MNDIRESHIIIKSNNYNPELVDTKFHFKINLGANEYEANLNKIKGLGVDPSENVFVLSHEFDTEEAAQNAVLKINDTLENAPPQLALQFAPVPPVWEKPKAVGRTAIVCFRVPELLTTQLAMIQPMISALEEISPTTQYLGFEVYNFSPPKEVFEDSSSDSKLVTGSFTNFSLVTHKDLPNKVGSMLTEMGAPDTEVTVAKTIFSSLKRVHIDVEVAESNIKLDKEYIKSQLLGMVQSVHKALAPLDLYEVAKSMGKMTNGTMCISPAISIDIGILFPSFSELLNIVKLPNP